MATPNEEAERRLFDMLAGWSDFADDHHYDDCETEAIGELYQAAANIDTSVESPSLEQIEEFIKTKVLPLILKGA